MERTGPDEGLKLVERYEAHDPDLEDYLWLTLTEDEWKSSLHASAKAAMARGEAPTTASPEINDFLSFARSRGAGNGNAELFAEWEQMQREARRRG